MHLSPEHVPAPDPIW